MNVPLSILEFGFINPPKLHAYETINAIINEIFLYEEAGYKRFWLSEHYSSEFAWYSPEMLLPILASHSQTIKIGWAGVLLNLHSPLQVGGNMRLLSSIFDNRIDLGVAAASANPAITPYLSKSDTIWPDKVKQLASFTRGEFTINDKSFFVPPHATDAPTLWYLTTGNRNIPLAVENRLNFAISFMHPQSNYKLNRDTIKHFKEAWYAVYDSAPETSVLVSTYCTTERRIIDRLRKRYSLDGFSGLFGDESYIKEQLIKMQEQLGNDEFCLYCPVCSRENRLESYQRIIQKYL